MAINDVLSALAQKLGLQATRLEDLMKMRSRLEDDIRQNQDRIGDLKNKVAENDAKLRAKKKEYDAAGPGIRKIIKSEFALLFRRQDQVLETLDSIAARIGKDNDLLHKLELLIEEMQHPPKTDMIDDVADDLGIVLEDIRDEDRSAERLNEVNFTKQATATDEQIANIDAATPERAEMATPEDDLDRMISEIN